MKLWLCGKYLSHGGNPRPGAVFLPAGAGQRMFFIIISDIR